MGVTALGTIWASRPIAERRPGLHVTEGEGEEGALVDVDYGVYSILGRWETQGAATGAYCAGMFSMMVKTLISISPTTCSH